jgi:CRISPR type III-B/RAMP module-associated protein Cmr5
MNGNSTAKTMEQRRAADAWEKMALVPEIEQNDYGRMIRKFPARIRQAGLGQALAFAMPKKNKEKPRAVRHLESWVLGFCGSNPHDDLLKEIMAKNASFLIQATEEALAWLAWAKRFCDAKGWGKDEGEDSDEEGNNR